MHKHWSLLGLCRSVSQRVWREKWLWSRDEGWIIPTDSTPKKGNSNDGRQTVRQAVSQSDKVVQQGGQWLKGGEEGKEDDSSGCYLLSLNPKSSVHQQRGVCQQALLLLLTWWSYSKSSQCSQWWSVVMVMVVITIQPHYWLVNNTTARKWQQIGE